MQLILFSKGKSKIWFIVVSIVLGKFPTHVYKINEKHLLSTNIYQWSTSLIISNGINITNNTYIFKIQLYKIRIALN